MFKGAPFNSTTGFHTSQRFTSEDKEVHENDEEGDDDDDDDDDDDEEEEEDEEEVNLKEARRSVYVRNMPADISEDDLKKVIIHPSFLPFFLPSAVHPFILPSS